MSSLAAARADNYYFPPEWTPDKGSINKFQKSHPLGHRAKKIDQGILVIRFEMPFNIWCNGCGNHIGKGVRYNAEKKRVGNYFSTPIWEFRMKCHLCENYIVVRTDPKASEYNIIEGGKRKNEKYEAQDNETIELDSAKVKEDILANPLFKLEHQQKDKLKADSRRVIIAQLQEHQERMKNDFDLSRAARKRFREEKKVIKSMVEEGKKRCLDVPLLPISDADNAKSVKFRPVAGKDRKIERLRISQSSIFNSQSSNSAITKAVEKKLNLRNFKVSLEEKKNLSSKSPIITKKPIKKQRKTATRNQKLTVDRSNLPNQACSSLQMICDSYNDSD